MYIKKLMIRIIAINGLNDSLPAGGYGSGSGGNYGGGGGGGSYGRR